MPPAAARNTRKRPGDLTGVRGQQLAQQAQRQKDEERKQVQAAIAADEYVKLTEEVDYSSETRARERERVAAGVVEETDIEPRAKTRRIRVNYPIEQMTFGREVISPAEYREDGTLIREAVLGSLRTFDFEEGRWYTVDADLADHLVFLGYVYDDK